MMPDTSGCPKCGTGLRMTDTLKSRVYGGAAMEEWHDVTVVKTAKCEGCGIELVVSREMAREFLPQGGG